MSKTVRTKRDLFDTEKGVLQFRNKKLTALLKLIPTKYSTRYALMHLSVQKAPPRMAATDGRRLVVFSKWHTNQPVENGLYVLGSEGILTKSNTADNFPKYEAVIPEDYNVAYEIPCTSYWISKVFYALSRFPNNLNIGMLWPVLKALDILKPGRTIVQGKKSKAVYEKAKELTGEECTTPIMIVSEIDEGQITYIQMPLNPEFATAKEMPLKKVKALKIDEENQNEQARTNGVQRPDKCEAAQSGQTDAQKSI